MDEIKELKLNLGCGTDLKEGYVNVDIADLPGINVKHDLNKFPYPFEANSVDEIYMDHVIGHLESPTNFLRECHRILKEGKKIIIKEPHFTSATAYWGEIRKWQFSHITLKRYEKGSKRSYYFDFGFSKVNIKFDFQKTPVLFFFYNYLIESIANKWPYAYEMTPLQAFPCRQMIIEFIK